MVCTKSLTHIISYDSRIHSHASQSGGIGRRDGFKIRFPQGSAGSIPAFGIYFTSAEMRSSQERGEIS